VSGLDGLLPKSQIQEYLKGFASIKMWKSEFDYTGIVKCDGDFFPKR